MAHVYVDSNAAGAGTGADWANAYTTIAGAFNAAGTVAGDNLWVAHNHAETQASAMTITSKGTAAAPCTVMCVTSAGSVPPVSADLRTTATVTTTGANALTVGSGHTYWYGITFSSGSGAVNTVITVGAAAAEWNYLNSCGLVKAGTTANTGAIVFGSTTAGLYDSVVLDNTTLKFGAAGDGARIRVSKFEWKNTASAIAGATIPTTLFSSTTSGLNLFDGVDLSAIDSGKTIVGLGSVSPATWVFKDCKLADSVTVITTPTGIGQSAIIARADSSGTNYRHEKYSYMGTQTVETTVVRTGGASDGTTPISWKIVTTANSKWILPYESLPIAIWNDTTAANVTVTVYGFWDSASVPNNDDIWIEVSYLGVSTSPLATINTSNTKADFLAANAAQGTDTSTWGGGDTTTPFKMSVTLSSPQPAQKGALYVTVKAAKASSTFYVDPKIELT